MKTILKIAALLLVASLSACAGTTKPDQDRDQPARPPANQSPVLIASTPGPALAELRMTVPNDRDFNVCAGDCLKLIVALAKPERPVSFSTPQQSVANATESPAPLPALDREAAPTPAAVAGGDMGNKPVAEQVERTDAAAGEYREPEKPGRTLEVPKRK